MKKLNIVAMISFLAGICFIAAFILHGGSLYIILGCLWVIIGIRRLVKPTVRK